MPTKELLLQAGVLVTLILGLVNLYFNLRAAKRTSFINTVTSERVKWIAKVRENVSTLCALCDNWMMHRTQESTPELQKQIEAKKTEIRLQLNPVDPEDQEIARLLDRLPSWTQSMTPEDYRALQTLLIGATQAMLKREWDKVKEEAVRGDLRKRKAADVRS
ncbi:MAG TPA: hypothetical protein PKN64_01505 [Casimicrobium sp.]|jgi:hypothetical protein|nr:hypothetical protein [Casimicrobium sp.]